MPNETSCMEAPSSILLCPLPLEFCELSDVELAVAVLVERPEDGVHVVLGQLWDPDSLDINILA